MRNMPRHIHVRLKSNVQRYKIAYYDGCIWREIMVSSRDQWICMCTFEEVLRILASPLSNEYNTKLHYKLDLRCKNRFELYFAFSMQNPTDSTKVYNFTLTDRNYGLPIEGKLHFLSVDAVD